MKIRSAVLMLIGALSMLSMPAVGQPDFGRYIVTLKDGADSSVTFTRASDGETVTVVR